MRPGPLVRRELNLRMREWNAFWVPLLYLGTLGLLLGTGYQPDGYQEPWQIGRQLFSAVSLVSLTLLALIVPVFGAGSLTLEREQRTLESLLLTSLSPREIVDGKLVATAAYGALLLATSLPLISLTAALGGVSWAVVACQTVTLAASALVLAAFGILVSAWFKRSAYAIAVCYGALALLLVMGVLLAGILNQIGMTLRLPLLRWLAFLTPFFVVGERTRGQWPLFLLWAFAVAWALRAVAVARLSREAQGRD